MVKDFSNANLPKDAGAMLMIEIDGPTSALGEGVSAIQAAAENDGLIEFKEALIFGLLGVLKLRGEINCLRSVTGAKKDHSSGQIYYP